VCTFRRASNTRVPPTVWSPFAHVNTREQKCTDVGTSVLWAGFERVFQLPTLKAPWSTQRLWSEFWITKEEVCSYSCPRFLWSSSVGIVQCLCTTQMTNTGNIMLWPSHFSLLWSAMQSSYSPKSDWWPCFVTRQTICICDWILLWRLRDDSYMKIQVCWDALSFWVVNTKHDR
jgi:hypothetical protein